MVLIELVLIRMLGEDGLSNSDGGKYSTSNSMTGESDEFDAPLVMQNVLVNGNDYEVLYFEVVYISF